MSFQPPNIYTLICCNKKNYIYNIRKEDKKDKKHLKKLICISKNKLLSDGVATTRKLVQIVYHNRKKAEDYVETTLRLDKKMSIKTSHSLRLDEDFLKELLLQIYLQVYYQIQLDEKIKDDIYLLPSLTSAFYCQ